MNSKQLDESMPVRQSQKRCRDNLVDDKPVRKVYKNDLEDRQLRRKVPKTYLENEQLLRLQKVTDTIYGIMLEKTIEMLYDEPDDIELDDLGPIDFGEITDNIDYEGNPNSLLGHDWLLYMGSIEPLINYILYP